MQKKISSFISNLYLLAVPTAIILTILKLLTFTHLEWRWIGLILFTPTIISFVVIIIGAIIAMVTNTKIWEEK